MKLVCINNKFHESSQLKLKIGSIYDIIYEDYLFIRINGPSEPIDRKYGHWNLYAYKFSKKKELTYEDDDFKIKTMPNEWYWEKYFKRLRDVNLELIITI